MALEGLNLGISKKKIKKEAEAKKQETPTLVFKIDKRAEGVADLSNSTAQYLETLTKDRAVDLWKVYYIKKTHNPVQAKNYKEICKYLEQRYGITIPKRI